MTAFFALWHVKPHFVILFIENFRFEFLCLFLALTFYSSKSKKKSTSEPISHVLDFVCSMQRENTLHPVHQQIALRKTIETNNGLQVVSHRRPSS